LAEEAGAAGDVLDAARARLNEYNARFWSEPGYVFSSAVPAIIEARGLFEAAADQLGVAMSESSLSLAYLGQTQWRQAGEAAKRGLEAALQAGNLRFADDMRFYQLNAACWGPTPVPELLGLADELLSNATSLLSRAGLLQGRALAHAWAGHGTAAREDIRQTLAIRSELQNPEVAWVFSEAPVESVLGDLEAADRAARWNIKTLERLEETGQRSTMYGFAARNLFEMGRPDADILADIEQCRQLAQPDDVVSQLQWRAALALVAARAGRIDEAKRWIEEGASIIEAEGVDFVWEQGLTWMDRGYVHMRAGEVEDARSAYGRALELFEAKGDVMDAARARERLAALRPPAG
jgi:tetratricopeptide (TPR) repeat protein